MGNIEIKSAIVLTAFGDRQKYIKRAVDNIREYLPGVHIYIYTDRDSNHCHTEIYKAVMCKDLWPRHDRGGNRNSDYYRGVAMLDLRFKYRVVLYMDDDLQIIHKGFKDIIDITLLHKTVTVVKNPRDYVGFDAKRGTDSPGKIEEKYYRMMGYNSGIIAAAVGNNRVQSFFSNYLKGFLEEPGRAPVHLWRAAMQTGLFPYVLPEQWLVMEPSAKRVFGEAERYEPMCIHRSDREPRRQYAKFSQAHEG